MNHRVTKLRRQSLDAVNTFSHERALLVTRFYRDMVDISEPVPIQQAKCFAYILNNKDIYIGEGELIIGERGPYPKATPSYPEVSLHTLGDLDMLDTLPKVSFCVSDEARRVYAEEVIPFWQGKTNRDRLMASMSEAWYRAYQAGIFTEFLEQRAPGHTVLGYKPWSFGMLDLIAECEVALTKRQTHESKAQVDEIHAMIIAAQAIIRFTERHAKQLDVLAAKETDPLRKEELACMAAICRKVPAHAPKTLHEALQQYWFIHLGVITEVNPWDSFNPGRLDQHLQPFYTQGISAGKLTRENAKELLQCF